jgi:hypothetical protein
MHQKPSLSDNQKELARARRQLLHWIIKNEAARSGRNPRKLTALQSA